MTKAALVLFSLLLAAGSPALAQQRKERAPDLTEGVGIEPRIGNAIPLDGEFTDETGRKVRLGDYFTGDKPVLLTLGYYRCPMLCDLVLNGAVEALKEIDWEPGDQYEIVTVSIDPLETTTLAKMKKQNYVKAFGRPSANRGWHFLTGNQKDITDLTDAVGFYYRYDEETKQFIHGAALFLVTPTGKLSRCLRGVVFKGQDIRLSLAEASEGKQVSTLDSLLLLCFHFDESRGTYSIQAVRVMQIGGAVVLVALALLLFPVWLRARRKKTEVNDPAKESR